jgi:hypothetical protein
MINHGRRSTLNPISTRAQAAAVAHSLARLCRLPRVRKVNGLDYCRDGRPEAWRIASEGSNPSSASHFVRTALAGGWHSSRCLRTNRFHAGRRTAIKPSSGWRLTAVGVIFYFPLLRYAISPTR